MATRKPTSPRARKKKDENESVAALMAALKFVANAQSDSKAETQHLHCMVQAGYLIASNPVFAMGCPVQDEFALCPNTAQFIDALSKCGQTVAITELDTGRLSVKSEKFKALVQCAPVGQMYPATPDTPCATINDALRAGFEAVKDIPAHISGREWAGGILLQAGSIVACDGVSVAEYWHGIDLPPNMLLPKESVAAVLKAGKSLAKLGFSENTVTFWFEDQSWLKTHRMVAQYPNYKRILDVPSNPWPLPEGFFTALKAVVSFSKAGLVFFNEGMMCSHPNPVEGASYEIEGLPADRAYDGKFLALFEGKADRFDFGPNTEGSAYHNCLFFGENLRGAVAPIRR